jgi:hypothetical protein
VLIAAVVDAAQDCQHSAAPSKFRPCVTKWAMAGANPREEPALWHVEFDDGDAEDLDEKECDAAIKLEQEFQRKNRSRNRR